MKNSISQLQEYTVETNKCFPQYIFESVDVPGYAFKCTVIVGSLTASGVGTTKQSAKHKSAQKALEQFGIQTNLPDDYKTNMSRLSAENVRAPINYVGTLNEIASINKKSYPIYEETLKLSPFKMTCSFLKWKTEGCGLNKKVAKQEAAQKMLEM